MLRKTLLFSAPLVALLAGCITPSTQNAYERDKPTYLASYIKDKRIETDPFLADKAHVLDIRQATVQDDLLKISVQVLNDDDWDGDVDYKFEWFDDRGMPVETPLSTWNTQHFGPREVQSLVSVAPDPRCKDFRLKLQRNQRN